MPLDAKQAVDQRPLEFNRLILRSVVRRIDESVEVIAAYVGVGAAVGVSQNVSDGDLGSIQAIAIGACQLSEVAIHTASISFAREEERNAR